jgi:hypothetical protein
VLLLDPTNLVWSEVAGAIGYDVVQGDLSLLNSSGGDFAVSTTGCVINDDFDLMNPQPADPATGEGQWFLVRAVLGGGVLSYDTFAASQLAPRDPGILASGNDCP